jgi:hypothetical protein
LRREAGHPRKRVAALPVEGATLFKYREDAEEKNEEVGPRCRQVA